MLKFIMTFSLFIGISFAQFNTTQVNARLDRVDDIYGFIKDNDNLIIGASGVVVGSFGNSKSIIARAVVVEKSSGVAKLEFSVFDDLAQDALPLPSILPQVGDEVKLNYLYDRSAIIAPSEEIYEEISQKLPNLYFTHIDIFGAQLIREGVLSPKRSNFRTFCAQNALGSIVFALEKRAKIVDCQSFGVLDEFELSDTTSIKTPFYSRVDGYKANIFDFNAQEIGNFYRYYDMLINLDK